MPPDLSSVPVRAALWTGDCSPRTVAILCAKVAGVPLLERQFLAFHQAGIRQVTVRVPSAILPDVRRLAHEYSPPDMHVDVATLETDVAQEGGRGEIQQSLLTVVDPRLVAQLASLARSAAGLVVCADAADGEAIEAKSPYRVGVPDGDEAKPADASVAATLVPIGLVLRAALRDGHAEATSVPTVLAVGRYYWHRLGQPADARIATWKILLATMKATDGVYAQTNRRVSLRISRALIDTSVSPNMVTLATLAIGVLAGGLLAQGQYLPVVAGSVLAWVASMLDGVDGEIARAKFQASAFGHWLEMVCDYAFYGILVVGLGEGFRRLTGQAMWLVMGCGAAVGVVLSFVVVARLKRRYEARASAADFHRFYQHSVTAPTAPWLMRITPHLTVFVTRAAFPYYFVLFAVLGLMKFVLVMFFLSTQIFWVGALILSRTVLGGRASIAVDSRR